MKCHFFILLPSWTKLRKKLRSSERRIFSSFVRNSFTSFFHNTYNFGGKKRKQKYVDLAVWVACRIRLISHFVRYVNYYSQRSMNFSTESNSLNSNFLTYYNFLNVTVVKKQLKRAQIIKLFLVHYGLGKNRKI